MAASMKTPVVVILGATGTGKTKLSLELARLFSGEIISADSMQVYKGLDIITNKASVEEQKVCPHHMIDYLSPHKTSTVQEYRAAAVPIMASILEKKKLPIIVGGTIYYIGALLWNSTIIDDKDIQLAKTLGTQTPAKVPKLQEDEHAKESDNKAVDLQMTTAESDNKAEDHKMYATGETGETDCVNRSEQQRSGSDNESSTEDEEEEMETGVDRSRYKGVDSTILYKRLAEVDKATAARLHPHNRRKIIRALEVYDRYGLPMSEVYKAQQVETEEHSQGGSLRYPDTCVFWLQCEQTVLDKRLDARVDTMIEQGLLQELTEFHQQYNEQRLLENKEADYTTGIFQSIGFKEFHNYVMLSEEEKQTDKGKQLFEKGVADLKSITRKYARYQTKRIRRLFFGAAVSQNMRVPVYGLDCTDVSQWDEKVNKPAVDILSSLVKGETPSIPPLEPEVEAIKFERNECRHCGVICVTQHEWEKHKKSKAHKARMKKYKEELRALSNHLGAYVSQGSGS